jgi:hypothetical protein
METTFNEIKPLNNRKGGRPKGSKNIVDVKKAIMEYTTPEELRRMVERAKKVAKTDSKMLQWYLEQVFGKAKVVEREGSNNKTTNNIAVFLDSLENGNRQKITGQVMETLPPLLYQGSEPEQDSIQAE